MKIEMLETGGFSKLHIYLWVNLIFFSQMWQYSLKKGIMKKFENWRYRENKRSPDFVEQKARKKKRTEGTFSSAPYFIGI